MHLRPAADWWSPMFELATLQDWLPIVVQVWFGAIVLGSFLNIVGEIVSDERRKNERDS